MSTHLPGFQSFLRFLHYFDLAKLATSSIRSVKVGSHIYSKQRSVPFSIPNHLFHIRGAISCGDGLPVVIS